MRQKNNSRIHPASRAMLSVFAAVLWLVFVAAPGTAQTHLPHGSFLRHPVNIVSEPFRDLHHIFQSPPALDFTLPIILP